MASVVSRIRPWAAAVAALIVSGCAHTSVEDPRALATAAPACRQETAERFWLTGPVTAEMAACVAATFQPTTRELILQSPGGDVFSALDIAQRFEGRRMTMRVRGRCSSACANYFLPLAGRIVVEPGALIEIHGSADPWTVDRFLTSDEAEMRTQGVAQADVAVRIERARIKLTALVERQAVFAERNGIAPGWLLYRTPGSDEVRGLSGWPGKGAFILVEEPMLRSCLPGVEIEPFQAELERRWLRSIRRLRLMWTGTVPSGQVVCSAPSN